MPINKTRAKYLLKESRHYLRSDLFHFIGRSQLRDLFSYEGSYFLYEELTEEEKAILGRELNEQLTQIKDIP